MFFQQSIPPILKNKLFFQKNFLLSKKLISFKKVNFFQKVFAIKSGYHLK